MNERSRRLLVIFSVCLNIGFIFTTGYSLVRKEIFSDYSRRALRHIKIFDQIDLESDRKIKIEKLVDAYVSTMHDNRLRLFKEKLKFLSLLKNGTKAESEQVERQLKSIQNLEQERGAIKTKHLIDVRDTLKPKQASDFFKILISRYEKKLKSF